MYEEKKTPPTTCRRSARIYAEGDDAYKFMFHGQGRRQRQQEFFLFQATPSVFDQGPACLAFPEGKGADAGAPRRARPNHLAIVIGGTSAELCMKTVKTCVRALSSTRLPTHGSADGNAFRDLEMEQEILEMTQSLGVGRAVRAASIFVMDVAGDPLASPWRVPCRLGPWRILFGGTARCSARSQRTASISRSSSTTRRNICRRWSSSLGGEVVKIDLNPADAGYSWRRSQSIRSRTRVAMTGTMIVAPRFRRACQIARAGWRRASRLPDYFQEIIRCTTPAPPRTPRRLCLGRRSAPTTRGGGWDSFVDQFQAAGRLDGDGRKRQSRDRGCARPARSTAASISARSGAPRPISRNTASRRSRWWNIPNSAMEAIWRIEVVDFPAFNHHRRQRGNDFFQGIEFGVIVARSTRSKPGTQ